MTKAIAPMKWLVKQFDVNAQKITDYDVLKYREDFIKKLKRKCAGKDEFGEALRREMMWRYWSKCEYEIIVKRTEDNRLFLCAWCGCYDENNAAIEVTDDKTFDWSGFAKLHIDSQIFGDEAKVDIYDQLMYRWDEFVDYCWEYRHKYQRVKRKD